MLEKSGHGLLPANPGAEAELSTLESGQRVKVKISKPLSQAELRTLAQNRTQWQILTAIAKQLQWMVDGKMEYLSELEWKTVTTSALKQEQRVAAGINGGFVMLGLSTSTMKVKEHSEYLEFLHFFCAEKGIKLPADESTYDYPEAQ